MSNLYSSAIHCKEVLTTHRFLQTLGVDIPRSRIREEMSQLPKYPSLSVKQIIELLEKWGLEVAAMKAKIEVLQKLDIHFLAYFRSETDGYFVIVEKVEAEYVHYYSPIRGNVGESLEKFSERWNGVIVVAKLTTAILTSLNIEFDDEEVSNELYKSNSLKVMDHFFTEEQCKYIVNYCEDNSLFKRSELIYDDGKVAVENTRTSFSAFIKDRKNPIFSNIYKTVSKTFNVSQEFIEDLQCVRYTEGQEFQPHFDSVKSTNRIHTILVYLNDNFESGETYFPELDMKIKPIQGRALYFLNRDENGNNILPSLHAGLPIQNGVKYGCNIWIKDSKEFKKQTIEEAVIKESLSV